jgi:hypothetical protein
MGGDEGLNRASGARREQIAQLKTQLKTSRLSHVMKKGNDFNLVAGQVLVKPRWPVGGVTVLPCLIVVCNTLDFRCRANSKRKRPESDGSWWIL